jgi:hypothetical protein
MLALGLLPLGRLRDNFQLAEIAHYTLLSWGISARYSAMLQSAWDQFLPEKDARSDA